MKNSYTGREILFIENNKQACSFIREIRVIFSMPHPCYLPATLNATYAKSKSINLKKSNEKYFNTQF